MEKKKHHDEMLKLTSGGTKLGKDEALIKEVESLNLDVPQEIMQRIESEHGWFNQSAHECCSGVQGQNAAFCHFCLPRRDFQFRHLFL